MWQHRQTFFQRKVKQWALLRIFHNHAPRIQSHVEDRVSPITIGFVCVFVTFVHVYRWAQAPLITIYYIHAQNNVYYDDNHLFSKKKMMQNCEYFGQKSSSSLMRTMTWSRIYTHYIDYFAAQFSMICQTKSHRTIAVRPIVRHSSRLQKYLLDKQPKNKTTKT